tara:strand:- start:2667 stop:3239 length:573 start_codon:yes stop_codon:yes gene_type:complete
MQPGDQGEPEEDGPEPFDSETHLRILDIQERRPFGHEVHCLSEPSMHLVRARVNDQGDMSSGSKIEVDSDNLGPLSEVRHRDLSPSANGELTKATMGVISEDSEKHLGFYNRANNLSLKMHAFQLLPGIGNAKALQMVQIRGIAGWSNFEEVDEACGINSVRLLAERYVKEMEDATQSPRLLDLLVRSEM